MAKCSLCKQKTGWFRSVHQECATKRESAITALVELNTRFGLTGKPADLDEQSDAISAGNFVESRDQEQAWIKGTEQAIERFVEGNIAILDLEEVESRLIKMGEMIAIDSPDFLQGEIYTKLMMNAVLNDFGKSRLPRWNNVHSGVRLNLKKDEYPLWIFGGTRYFEEKTFRHYEGRSQGVSVRIAKGVSYRVGSSKGYLVDDTKTVLVDTGLLGFTNKQMHFAGSHKGFRISYEKIAAFEHYSDGLKIIRDSVSAKPQVFVTGNGWFISRLLESVMT
jgi:hypothetical protein